MDERLFFQESVTQKPAELNCPHCRTMGSYQLRWVVRQKKKQLTGNASPDARRKFEKAQSYMVLADDKATCANERCRRPFEISGIKTIAFL